MPSTSAAGSKKQGSHSQNQIEPTSAMKLIGQPLAASPVGTDEIWPAEAVREIIESIGSQDIESGIHLGVSEQSWCDQPRRIRRRGKQEWALAATYRASAAHASTRWPRTSRILRGLAESYEQEARREDFRGRAPCRYRIGRGQVGGVLESLGRERLTWPSLARQSTDPPHLSSQHATIGISICWNQVVHWRGHNVRTAQPSEMHIGASTRALPAGTRRVALASATFCVFLALVAQASASPRGSMAIAVRGLPQHQPAVIVVSGPGYRRVVSAARASLRGLRPGVYVLTLRPVVIRRTSARVVAGATAYPAEGATCCPEGSSRDAQALG